MIMIRTIFSLIVVIIIIALITNQYRKTGKPFPLGWIGTGAGMLLVVFLFSRGCNKPTATPPQSVMTTIVIKKVGKQPTLYKFSDYADNCVSLKIEVYDFYWYPKGGRVTAFPPKGEPFVDTPGVDVKTHYEPGVWRWCAKDPGTIGIEVWQ